MSLTVVPLELPKRLNDFQTEVEKLTNSDAFGKLTVAETIGVLQIVILNLWHRMSDEIE